MNKILANFAWTVWRVGYDNKEELQSTELRELFR
jgi:hypothetical protein